MKQFEISLSQIVQAQDLGTKKVQVEAFRKIQASNKTIRLQIMLFSVM